MSDVRVRPIFYRDEVLRLVAVGSVALACAVGVVLWAPMVVDVQGGTTGWWVGVGWWAGYLGLTLPTFLASSPNNLDGIRILVGHYVTVVGLGVTATVRLSHGESIAPSSTGMWAAVAGVTVIIFSVAYVLAVRELDAARRRGHRANRLTDPTVPAQLIGIRELVLELAAATEGSDSQRDCGERLREAVKGLHLVFGEDYPLTINLVAWFLLRGKPAPVPAEKVDELLATIDQRLLILASVPYKEGTSLGAWMDEYETAASRFRKVYRRPPICN
ncbi:hypothetical protein P3H15_31345 [Rhodococcus sp. T2V]|uniref:hypothetical protein n=1 Tax=Rhodococcus sp. T2V TaxID=3034164 RepID=UPI0023E1D0FF|nr:hypothetical protein [Rhodococcus sp. T2V]MDF3309516.1 hypothetical protein [Rhodococcus sp. T2V]